MFNNRVPRRRGERTELLCLYCTIDVQTKSRHEQICRIETEMESDFEFTWSWFGFVVTSQSA